MQIAKEPSVEMKLTIKQWEEETVEPVSVETKEVSCAEVIDYLNGKYHKKYRLTTGKTQKLINARVREGFVIDDFTPKVGRAKM
ncbi:conserved phage C-terminal domain-containing protein [Clostridium gasigenes]|uniref:conserved phage C-terminal domain-containing protein n=1 Tax=Clostridium gasigenes TaxID=94869 RepID=UPI001C0AA46D|nr:conserved phage C-terminal domain-containing protein [Clostridium gasigenes]MBU3107667.1 conserved phage C-terminal domain-containing protein [Clostridium gasigenes]